MAASRVSAKNRQGRFSYLVAKRRWVKCPQSSRQNREKRKARTIRRWSPFLFASNSQEFHRCHTTKSLLISFTVVKMDVWSNRITKLIILIKMIQVVYLRFQNPPKILHRRIIQTFAWRKHALADSSFFHSLSKGAAGILSAPVTVDQWTRIRIPLKRLLKGFKYQRNMIPLT